MPGLDIVDVLPPSGPQNTIDSKVTAASIGVPLPANALRLGGSLVANSSGALTRVALARPANATPYLAGDVIGTAASALLEFTDMGSTGDVIQLLSGSVMFGTSSPPSGLAQLRLHIFAAAVSAGVDNDPFASVLLDGSSYAGEFLFALPVAVGGAFLFQTADYLGRSIKLRSNSVFGELVTIGAFTPPSAMTVELRLSGVKLG